MPPKRQRRKASWRSSPDRPLCHAQPFSLLFNTFHTLRCFILSARPHRAGCICTGAIFPSFLFPDSATKHPLHHTEDEEARPRPLRNNSPSRQPAAGLASHGHDVAKPQSTLATGINDPGIRPGIVVGPVPFSGHAAPHPMVAALHPPPVCSGHTG